MLATFQSGVVRLTRTSASPQVTPAIAADPAGNPWAAGSKTGHGKLKPAIINAPGIATAVVTAGVATPVHAPITC